MKSSTFTGRFSLLQQWAAATVLAIIPLLIAVSYAAYALQQQTRSQRQLVARMDTVASSNSAVGENVKEMVRLSWQYSLLGDERFIDLYKQKLESMAGNLDTLRSSLPGLDGQGSLDALLIAATDTGALFTANPAITRDELSPHISSLLNLNEQLTREVNRHRRSELMTGEQEFNRIVDQLFFLTILALPGTFLLMIVGTFMVSRPLWRLSQAIQQLGRQEWETPVTIQGPSDLAALGNSLEWMRQQVWSSERQKTAFIQHVTHELKTPLAAIIEAGNLLDEEVPGPLNPGQRSVLGILRANARNLEQLIQQLLNYNAVSHGMVAQWQNIDLSGLCQSIRIGLEATSPGKKIQWRFAGSPADICSDPRLLDMILRNIIGNAFQFTEGGGSISVAWHQDADKWQLSVTDSGPGIDPDEMENIYTPFFKGRTGRQSKVPKNGIGLSIVFECVSLLKGTISASSIPGEGATFTLSFPLVEALESP